MNSLQSRPKVSACIIAYSQARYIERCAQGIVGPTAPCLIWSADAGSVPTCGAFSTLLQTPMKTFSQGNLFAR